MHGAGALAGRHSTARVCWLLIQHGDLTAPLQRRVRDPIYHIDVYELPGVADRLAGET